MELITGGKADYKETACGGAVILLGRSMVVLVRPLNGRDEWLLPKGHVEINTESSANAAVREAIEETGAIISKEVPQLITTTSYEDHSSQEAKTTDWYLLTAVALMTEKSEVQPDRGRRHIGVFPLNVAVARLTYYEHRQVLTQVLGAVFE